MKANKLTFKEKVEGTFLISCMSVLLYVQAADFKLVLFIMVCFVYLHDEKIRNRKRFEQLKAELATLKADLESRSNNINE
jgi:hypothetical protein